MNKKKRREKIAEFDITEMPELPVWEEMSDEDFEELEKEVNNLLAGNGKCPS